MITLTEDQQKASDLLDAFLDSKRDDVFVLEGSAGTGKTWLVKNVSSQMPETMVLTAPTNKAVSVLEKGMPADTPCMTTHKFLGLKVQRYEDKTKVVRNNNYDPSQYAHVRVVALDESSMVDDQLLKYIQTDIQNWGRKYIFIGDPYQLFPVAEDECRMSRTFDMASSDKCKATLHKIVRQAEGNPIIQMATDIRDAITEHREPSLRAGYNSEMNTGVYILRSGDFNKKLQEYTEHEDFHHNADFCRVVAWRNATVNDYNKQVRHMLKQDPSIPFCPGDIVTVNEAYVKGDEVLFNTGTEVTVSSIAASEHPVFPEIKAWKVELFEAVGYDFWVLMEEAIPVYKSKLNKFKQDAFSSKNWGPYYGLAEFFIDLRPLFSITCHKSQGSTFENTFVDLPDIYKNKRKTEADHCLYTAVTRSSKNVFIKI